MGSVCEYVLLRVYGECVSMYAGHVEPIFGQEAPIPTYRNHTYCSVYMDRTKQVLARYLYIVV